LIEKAAAQGYAGAQTNLGWMYVNGIGVPRDYSKARQWYEKAASQGDVMAQNNLGWMYDNGRGVPRDYGKARQWYEKAASQGDVMAQNNLGKMRGNQNVYQGQQRLKELGYDLGTADGLFGTQTRAALINYQKDKNIPETGKFDKVTANSLGVKPYSQHKVSKGKFIPLPPNGTWNIPSGCTVKFRGDKSGYICP